MSEADCLIHCNRNIGFDPLNVGNLAAGITPSESTTALSNFGSVELSWRNLAFDVPASSHAGTAGHASRRCLSFLPVGRKKNATDAEDSNTHTASSDETDASAFENIDMQAHPDLAVNSKAQSSGSRPLARVLHGVYGSVRPGQLLAILGTSGSGKSTLLNLLAGRIKSSRRCVSSGTVLVNGSKRDFSVFKQVACYVEQDEAMFAELTVEEQLRYSALLRLPASMSKEDKLSRVEDVIQELGLSHCKRTRVGSRLVQGISGGERKRLSIGTELVTNPSLFLLDEPTTGLDSFNALNVMTTLKQLATNGRTVVTTLHQPRSSIAVLFDMLCILSEGRQVYFGPAKDAPAYFAGLGFCAPLHFNFPDYAIDAVSIDYRSQERELSTKKRVLYLAEALSSHLLADTGSAGSEHDVVNSEQHVTASPDRLPWFTKTSYPNNALQETRILLGRALKRGRREKLTNLTRFIRSFIFGILLGLIWLSAGRETDVESRLSVLGVVFFLAINQGFDGSFSVIFDFQFEKAVLTKERSCGTYRTISYFASSLVVNAMKSATFNAIFVTIVYWMVGLRSTFTAYLFTWLTTSITSQAGEAISQCISVFTGDAQVAAATVPLVMVLSFLFAGFFISKDALPGFLRWAQKLSFLYWSFQALAKNQYRDFQFPKSFRLANELNSYSRWENFVILLCFVILGKALFFLILLKRRPQFDKSL